MCPIANQKRDRQAHDNISLPEILDQQRQGADLMGWLEFRGGHLRRLSIVASYTETLIESE